MTATDKIKNTTIETISYRFTHPETGESKTSKASIDKEIYAAVIAKLGKKEGHEFLTSKMRIIRETQAKSWASFLREIALMKLIPSELLEGYTLTPEYEVVMCPSKQGSQGNTAVNIPASIYYAIGRKIKNKPAESVIKEEYFHMREEQPDEGNFSFTLRTRLLKILTD
ncbi:TPA: hypothetical protein I7730_14510 [Vibrio vulnificus]|uniref:Uncharacterized protein n=1 Tax=Vibrio vulnificus TaxID=672 RepID=A0A8H9TGA5_VIBVL|nr:hypothetical protein [Vibrio vulnificus]HAS8541000.1 hypothetical protein [Vibrio vulnificus]